MLQPHSNPFHSPAETALFLSSLPDFWNRANCLDSSHSLQYTYTPIGIGDHNESS